MSDVVNLRDYRVQGRGRFRFELPADVLRVDRATPWGNPFRLGDAWGGRPMGRAEVLVRFREYAAGILEANPGWLRPLVGMRLACHCAPLRCHAEVLVELRDRLYPREAASA